MVLKPFDKASTDPTEASRSRMLTAPFTPERSSIDVSSLLPIDRPFVIKNDMTGKFLLVKDGQNVTDADTNDSADQLFVLQNVSDGVYNIMQYQTDKALTVKGNSSSNGTEIVLQKYVGNRFQQWQITADLYGKVKIISVGAGKSLDMHVSERKVILWDYNGGSNQVWYFQAKNTL